MNPTECKALTDLVKALWPGSPWDEHSDEAWHLVLEDTDARDALEAVRDIARSGTPFMPRAGEVYQRVVALRRQRIAKVPSTAALPHGEIADRPEEWLVEHRQRIEALANGLADPDRGALPPARGAVPPPVARQARARLIPGMTEERAAEFQRQRQISMTADCDYCPANAGQVCRNTVTGLELTAEPAHESRLVKTGAIPPPAAPRQLPPGFGAAGPVAENPQVSGAVGEVREASL